MSGEFYTYMHCRKTDGKVFYVGKGKGRRAWSRNGRSIRWCRVVDKHGLNVEVCARWGSEAEAFAHEVFLIDTFRSLGYELTNATDGGEGISGFKATSEQRAARSAAQKLAEKITGRQSAFARGLMTDPERAQRIHSGRDAHFSVKENRDAVGKRISSYYRDPANRAAHSARCSERLSATSERERMSRMNGGRPFIHEQTGVVYVSQGLAAKATGIAQSAISNVLHRKKASVLGEIFTYIEE